MNLACGLRKCGLICVRREVTRVNEKLCQRIQRYVIVGTRHLLCNRGRGVADFGGENKGADHE